MKITKFAHSCLLVESSDQVALFDPGNFSWEHGNFDINKLERLDDLIITHEHQDHMHLPFIKEILMKFPEVRILSTASVAEQLAAHGIRASTESNQESRVFKAGHESLGPVGAAPQNIGVHYLNKLTHPGDCHHFSETMPILALPMIAPWGSLVAALELSIRLKPRVIIPIHDFHYKSELMAGVYAMSKGIFAEQEIDFIIPIDGQAFEIAD